MEIIESLFPDLQGMESVKLYTQNLGTDKSIVPGPSTVYIEGIIKISKEMSEQYFKEYSWESIETKDLKGNLELPEGGWLYSKAFEERIKPSYYYGKIYFNKTGYLFFFMTLE